MTTEELRIKFIYEFGLGEWPRTYEVDAETYINVCNSIFEWAEKDQLVAEITGVIFIRIALGPNRKIMFKNVELLLKK